MKEPVICARLSDWKCFVYNRSKVCYVLCCRFNARYDITFTSLTELNVALLCRIAISSVIGKQNARLGDEVRNWIINFKAVSQNNKCSRRFPRTTAWQRHVVLVFLGILVICLIRDNTWNRNYFLVSAFKKEIAYRRVYGAFFKSQGFSFSH